MSRRAGGSRDGRISALKRLIMVNYKQCCSPTQLLGIYKPFPDITSFCLSREGGGIRLRQMRGTAVRGQTKFSANLCPEEHQRPCDSEERQQVMTEEMAFNWGLEGGVGDDGDSHNSRCHYVPGPVLHVPHVASHLIFPISLRSGYDSYLTIVGRELAYPRGQRNCG